MVKKTETRLRVYFKGKGCVTGFCNDRLVEKLFLSMETLHLLDVLYLKLLQLAFKEVNQTQ